MDRNLIQQKLKFSSTHSNPTKQGLKYQARWDQQIETDSNSGKLDFLINAALLEYEAGTTRDL